MILKFILRNLKKNKLRTLLILVSVLLSAIVIFLNLSMGDCVEKLIREESTKMYANYNLAISSKDGNFNSEDIVWKKSKPVDQTDIVVTILSNEDGDVYKLNSIDYHKFLSKNLIEIKDGSDKLGKSEVIVDEESADDNGWKVGDILTNFTPTGKKQNMTISAIAYNTGFLSQTFSFPTLISDIQYDRDILEYKDSETTMVMCEFDTADITLSEIKEQIEENNNKMQVKSLLDEDNIKTQVSTVRMIFIILLILVLMLNYYIISSNAKVILESRTSVLATFRSIGATKGKVIFVILMENIVYGIIGGIVGCLIGVIALKPVTTILVGSSDTDWSVNITKIVLYIIFTIIFSILVQILCSLRHVVKFSKRSIKEMLFEKSESVYKVSKLYIILGFVLLGFAIGLWCVNSHYNLLMSVVAMAFTIIGIVEVVPFIIRIISIGLNRIFDKVNSGVGQVVAKSLGFNKTSISNAILLTIALSIMLSVYMLSLGVNSMFESPSVIMSPTDIQIGNITKELDAYDQIDKIDEIDSKTGYYYSLEDLTVNDVDIQAYVTGLDDEGIGVTNGTGKSISNLSSGQCLVDSYYALKQNIGLGDKVHYENSSFIVKGFVDASYLTITRNVVVIPSKSYIEKVGKIPQVIYAHIHEGKDVNNVKKEIKEKLAMENVTVMTFQEHLDIQHGLVSNIMLVVWVILALAVIMSVIGIINNQMIGFMQRQREYAVLNSVAMSMRQILLTIFMEMLGTFIIACILGSIVSVWLNVVLRDVLYSVGLGWSFKINYVSIMQISAVTLFILMISSVIPISKIRRMNLIEVIKSNR